MIGARSFPGNPYDGHTLAAQLEQTNTLLQDLGRSPKQAIVDMGFRGADDDNPGIEIIHRGRDQTLTSRQKRWLKRRQAIERPCRLPTSFTRSRSVPDSLLRLSHVTTPLTRQSPAENQ